MKYPYKMFAKITMPFLVAFLLAYPFYASYSNTNVSIVSAQKTQTIPELKKGMYVILGAFQILENATKYAKSIQTAKVRPLIGHYAKKNMYYIYAFNTLDNIAMAREKRAEYRATSQFYDAWILYVGLSVSDFDKDETLAAVASSDEMPSKSMEENKEESLATPASEDEELYNYRFNVINATTFKEVPGYVAIIDAARDKAMKSVSTNQIHSLEAPTTQTKEITVQCDIFGYVKEQVTMKIDDPLSSKDKNMISESGGITTVKFELARHKVGDILTMYHVYFYTDAAIMKPESKFELNNLLSMLKENDKLMIRIHGHTNGNAAGKIIRLKKDDKNYFSISSDNEESMGSAKELSKARGEIIAQWLEDQGIDKKRMDIKAWGGKKMLYKKNESMAGKNVRVEIEILKD